MGKGIIMEIQDKTLVVLTNDGQFLTTRKRDYVSYQVGDEIIFDSVQPKPTLKSFTFSPPSKVWVSSAAVIVLLLASFLFNFGLSEQKVYAYVTVDINPSFELTVDDEWNIIKIIPLNSDAENVLAGITEWKDQPLANVTASLVIESKEEGYLASEQTVILSTVLVEENEEEELETEIKQVQSEMEKELVQVKWFEGTKEDRKAAKNAGVSTGKLIETRNENKPAETTKKQEKTDKEATNPKKLDQSEDARKGNSSNKEKGKQPKNTNRPAQKNESETGPDPKDKSRTKEVYEEEEPDKKTKASQKKKNENNGNQNDKKNGNNGKNENKGANSKENNGNKSNGK